MGNSAVRRCLGRRSRYKNYKIVCFQLAILFGAGCRLYAADDPIEHPRDAADILIVGGTSPENGVYLVDPSSRAVYYHPIPRTTSDTLRTDLPYADFTLVAALPGVRKPTALAYYGGKLYVLDKETAMVKLVDIGRRTVEDLEIEGVRNPTAIAVSESGEIAIADERIHSVLRIAATGGRTLTRYTSLDNSARLAYDRSNLLILERRTGRSSLYDLLSDGRRLTVRPTIEGEISDFALQRGILYLAAPDQIAVYSPDTSVLKINFTHPDRVFATDDALAILSRSGKFVRILPKLVPVKAFLEGSGERGGEKNNRGLVELYEYLSQRGILATYDVTAPPNFSALQKIVLSEWILLPTIPDATDTKVDMDSETKRKFQKIVCDLNRSFCGSGIDPSKLLTRRVFADKVLTMPEVYVEDARNPGEGKLGKLHGKNGESTGTANQSAVIKQQYSLTAELDRLHFIEATPPSSAIQPGTFVRLDNGRTRIAERPSLCASGRALSQPERQPVSLRPNLALSIASESFPSLLTQNTGLGNPRKSGISQISATFEGVERKALEAGKFVSSLPMGKCVAAYTDVKTVLAPEVLTVTSARYRLTVSSPSLLPRILPLLRSQLAGRDVSWTLLSDGFELTLHQSFTIGFTAIPLQSGANGKLIASDPLDTRTLATRTQTRLGESVPGPSKARWQLTFLAPAREVNDISSSLRRLEQSNDDMYLWSAEEQLTSGKSSEARSKPLSVEEARGARQAMMSRIDYPPTQPDLSRSAVGILESSGDVNVKHGAFCAGTHSLWIDGLGGSQEPCQEGSAAAAADASENAERSDHGTHVAGLLSTGPQSPIPSLLPNARMGLIDIGRLTAIQSQMQKAITEQVIVFNFSGSIPKEAEAAWLPVKRKIKKDWQDRLFVVAAGNDGADLSLSSEAPIQWSTVPPFDQNLIAVGAADWSKHPLGVWKDIYGNPHPGSNWGRDFVQLLADGLDVASAADSNSYGFDTGTSMAAPQVSAAAVLLEAGGVREPNRIKARLISTADWDPTYQDFVAGGYLNVRAAAWMPSKAGLATQSEPKVWRFVNDLNTPSLNERITVEEGTCHRTNAQQCRVPAELRFETILRIQREAGEQNRFRVWFVEPDFKYLTVLDDVLLSGNLQFTASQVWNAEQKRLIDLDREAVSLGVAQIFDYIASEARIPRDIKF